MEETTATKYIKRVSAIPSHSISSLHLQTRLTATDFLFSSFFFFISSSYFIPFRMIPSKKKKSKCAMIIIIRNKYSSELICYWIIGGGQMELSNGADQQVYSGNWRPKLEEVEELWRGNWKEVQMKGGNQIFLYNNVSCCWMAVGIEKNVYIIVYRYMCVCVRMCFPLSTEIMSKEEPYYIYIFFFLIDSGTLLLFRFDRWFDINWLICTVLIWFLRREEGNGIGPADGVGEAGRRLICMARPQPPLMGRWRGDETRHRP